MIFSRHIYFMILLHIVLILITSGTGLWMIISHTGYIIGSILILCSLLQIAGLTKKLNVLNRKIQLFFDAVQDKENMLYYPEQNVSKEQQLLNRSLNRINDLLAKTKKENQKQEYFYRSLIEEVPSGVVAWNTDGKIIIANSAALTLLGCHQLGHQHQLPQLLQHRKNLSLSQNRMTLEGMEITLLSIKDIGDELSDKESESWSKLTHVLTHEIMNTIAPIISLSQTLSTYSDINEKAIRGLNIIREQSERLLEFTESFRQLSYMPRPQKKLFSLTNLLNKLQILLQSDFEEHGITFTVNSSPASIYISADQNQLFQVFLNLLKNAMQALANQDEATISINTTLESSANNLIIDLTDNGPGIPEALQEKIFIPFFTTKSEGTGIGLSLCKQIIRLHGGHLFIRKSIPGHTSFRIDLPVA